MLPEIRIDSFDGPTLLELAPVIDEIPDPIEARWAGTPAEFLFLAKVTNRSLILYVQDFHAQDRITLLGGENLAPGVIAALRSSFEG